MESNDKQGWQQWRGNKNDVSDGLLQRIWEATDSYKQGYQPDTTNGFAALQTRMDEYKPVKMVRMTPAKILLRVAASAAILVIGVVVFKNFTAGDSNLQALVTTAGSTDQVFLSDGSTVALNHSSKLDYTPTFNQEERRVKLSGEAFFEVSRDESRPFLIETEYAEVEVLGTAFNIRAYPEEEVFEVFVSSGKVSVRLKETGQQVALSEGAVFKFNKSKNKAVTVKDDSGIQTAWHSGTISFKGHPIPVILAGMERLYGVKIDLKKEQHTDCLQTLTLNKDKFDVALKTLKVICPSLTFEEVAAKTYLVTGTCCD